MQINKSVRANSYMRTFATAGVKLSFNTDSENLFLKVVTDVGSARKYFSVDVFEDDEEFDHFFKNLYEQICK